MFSINYRKVFQLDIVTARFVGGCVRKHLTNDKVDDIDIATILSSRRDKRKDLKIQILKLLKLELQHGTVTLVSKNFKA